MLTMVLIDTSVLLKDPDVIIRVIGNKGLPFITNTILSELDFNKKNLEKKTSENAKNIFRIFARSNSVFVSQMPDGKSLQEGDSLRQLDFRGSPIYVLVRKNPNSRNDSDNDFKIIKAAKDYGMTIITRDQALKTRAEVEGVDAHVHNHTSPKHQPSVSQTASNKTLPEVQPFTTPISPLTENDALQNVSILPSHGDIVATRNNGLIKLLKVLSSGGEGSIYETDKSDFVCKVYHKNSLTKLRQKKVELMLTRKIDQKGICWPIDVALNSNNEFVGYIMPRASGRPIQSTMFVKPVLEKTFPKWGRIDLVNLCIAFLDQITYLHNLNIFVGDINPLNLLVDADSTRLWIVDTDSFQIEGFPCPVGTVNFTAPEIQGKNYADFLRTKEHELFAVATMLFMILLPGKPPYAQQGGGNPAENILKMDFSYPFGGESNGKAPKGPWQNIWGNLTWKLREAFSKTFKNNQRIEIREWKGVLIKYQSEIRKGQDSNELFPTTFKIRDPVEVVCGNCAVKVIASEKRVEKMAIEGKKYFCGKCLGDINLNILAQKARKASHAVFQSNSSAARQTSSYTGATYQNPNATSHYNKPRIIQPSQKPISGGGVLNWVLSIFK